MNIYDIKRKANELLVNHDKLFKVLLYIGIIQAIFSAVSTLFDGVVGGIVSLIITILTLTLSHGAIVASLKTVNNMEESIDEKEDALVGLKKIGHLFPTYFLYDFIIGIICFVVGIIGFLIIMSVSSVSIEQFLQLFTITINGITVSQAQITDYFDDSICGDEVTKGKPNPEVFLKSCQKLGVNVDEAIVLEDSEAGIQASYDAGIKVICIPDMKYPEKQYEEKTFKILKDLNDVTEYLKSL